ncbi:MULTISPECIES: hypothetical protein [Streptomyces]|uniref:hypothetical protein n=1 Tax=Streptomyces TaxID=1883 RepID=UPI002248AE7F|nr:hypothetical protein [Streptomyces sp. JHD 1]MCX2970710.1 hypothetical protein [Streptomyces sp. JHD 1]
MNDPTAPAPEQQPRTPRTRRARRGAAAAAALAVSAAALATMLPAVAADHRAAADPAAEPGAAQEDARELVRNRWFERHTTTEWSKNFSIYLVDFHPDRRTSLTSWRTGVKEGAPAHPVTLYRQARDPRYGDIPMPQGAPYSAKIVDLNGFGAQGYVEQDVPTQKGQRYTLTYWLGYDVYSGTGVATMAAQASAIDRGSGDTLHAKTTKIYNSGKLGNGQNNNPGWKQASLTFTADSGTTTIRIQDQTGPVQSKPTGHVGTTGANITGVSVRAGSNGPSPTPTP